MAAPRSLLPEPNQALPGQRLNEGHGASLTGLFGSGIADWGTKTPSEMLAMIRDHASEQRRIADEILNASDSEFRIETYLGPHAQRDRKIIQAGRKR